MPNILKKKKKKKISENWVPSPPTQSSSMNPWGYGNNGQVAKKHLMTGLHSSVYKADERYNGTSSKINKYVWIYNLVSLKKKKLVVYK